MALEIATAVQGDSSRAITGIVQTLRTSSKTILDFLSMEDEGVRRMEDVMGTEYVEAGIL